MTGQDGIMINKTSSSSHLETLWPGWSRTVHNGIGFDGLKSPLEEDQDAVHDAHDEVGRPAQLADRGWKQEEAIRR